MSRFLVLGFEHNNVIDYCLIRLKIKGDCNEYAITIMNGKLEKLLFGSHTITEKDGCLLLEASDNKEQYRLKEQITKSLGELLGLPVQNIATVN